MTPCFASLHSTLTSCKNLPPRLEAPIMDAEAADMNAEAPADWLGGPGVPYTSITLLCKSSLRIVDDALNFQTFKSPVQIFFRERNNKQLHAAPPPKTLSRNPPLIFELWRGENTESLKSYRSCEKCDLALANFDTNSQKPKNAFCKSCQYDRTIFVLITILNFQFSQFSAFSGLLLVFSVFPAFPSSFSWFSRFSPRLFDT